MKKNTNPSYVTEATFKKESKITHNEFKKVRHEMHQEFTNVRQEMHLGFEQVNQRFEKVDQRIEKVDQRLEKVDQRLDNLDATVGRIALSVVRHEADIKEIKETMMTRDMGMQLLLQQQDLALKYENAERSAKIHLNQVMDFRPKIEDHEKRLVALENNS